MSRPRRAAVVFVLLLAAGVGGGWLAHAIRVGQERGHSVNALRGIFLHLALYADIYKGLPPPTVTDPDGRPLYSWRFGIVAPGLNDHLHAGFYGQAARLDKAWDSPENRRYHSEPYSDLPGGPAEQIDATRPGGKARFVAVVGPGTAFDDTTRRKLDELPGDVLLVVEATGCRVHWMEPGGDVDVRTMPRQIGAAGSSMSCSRTGASGCSGRTCRSRPWRSSSPSPPPARATATPTWGRTPSSRGRGGGETAVGREEATPCLVRSGTAYSPSPPAAGERENTLLRR